MKYFLTVILNGICFCSMGQAITNMPGNTPAIGVAASYDQFTYDSKQVAHYGIGWYNDSWQHGGASAYLSGWGGLRFFTMGRPVMSLSFGGNVGIGTESPTSKLTVAGNIEAREVKVSVNAGADFVFNDSYVLMSLKELESFLKQNKHLPDIASASYMEKNGVNLSDMNIRLLQKIEELTLYLIEQNKVIQYQSESLKEQADRIDRLEKSK